MMPTEPPLERKILSILFLTLLLDITGIGMIVPVLPSLFTDPQSHSFMLHGYSTSLQLLVAGLLTAFFGFTQFIMSPILGELSDVYGRKTLLMIGVGVLAVSQALFATGIMVRSVVLLFVSRGVAGMGAANYSIAQAAIADVTAPGKRARNFGVIGAAFGLGFILGPLLGGWLAGQSGNPALPFISASILGILNFIFVLSFLPETRQRTGERVHITFLRAWHNVRDAYQDRDVRPVYFASFFALLGFGFFTTFIAIFLEQRFGFKVNGIGAYFGIIGAWVIVTQLFFVRLCSRVFADRTLILLSLPVLALSIMAHPSVHAVSYLYVLIPFLTASFALISTSLPSLVSRGVGPDQQGAALGINGSLQALSQAVAPLLAALVASYDGISTSFYIGGFFVLLAIIFTFRAPTRST